MIYTKTKVEDGVVVRSPVTAKSTYTRCAMCGREIQMDLRELILAGLQDPYDTEVTCTDCSLKMMHKGNIDVNAIIRLINALWGIGYGLELYRLYDYFDIEDVCDLVPEEYEIFVDELLDRISEARHAG